MEAEMTTALIILAIGLLFLVIEAMMPGGYFLIPGGVCVVIGVYGMADSGDLYTWVTAAVAIAALIPVTLITIFIYRNLGDPEKPTTTVASSLEGRKGKVVIEVTPDNMKGKVKIDSDTWSATADSAIPVGTDVVVESAEGVHVRVKKE